MLSQIYNYFSSGSEKPSRTLESVSVAVLDSLSVSVAEIETSVAETETAETDTDSSAATETDSVRIKRKLDQPKYPCNCILCPEENMTIIKNKQDNYRHMKRVHAKQAKEPSLSSSKSSSVTNGSLLARDEDFDEDEDFVTWYSYDDINDDDAYIRTRTERTCLRIRDIYNKYGYVYVKECFNKQEARSLQDICSYEHLLAAKSKQLKRIMGGITMVEKDLEDKNSHVPKILLQLRKLFSGLAKFIVLPPKTFSGHDENVENIVLPPKKSFIFSVDDENVNVDDNVVVTSTMAFMRSTAGNNQHQLPHADGVTAAPRCLMFVR